MPASHERSRTMPSITAKTATALVTKALTAGWALEQAGSRWYARLETLPWVPAVAWRLCARIRAAGEALETFAGRVAPRLGVDMVADVLDPRIARAICA